jgi:phage shock protein PspC (stress-responsive transcriptional regulator)
MTMEDRQHDGPEEKRVPGAGGPGAGEPARGEPGAGEPARGELGAGEPGGGQPARGELGAGEPGRGQSSAGAAGAEGPRAPQPGPGPENPREAQAPPPPPPTAEAPTEPPRDEPRRLLRSRSNRVIGGVCGGLGRYFNVDPILFRIAAIALTLIGGAGLLLYVAFLLLVPSEPSDAAAEPPPERGNRALVIAVVGVALLIGWPFLLGGGLLVAGILVPLAFLVAAGVLVWWLVSGEGPSGDAGDIARRAALGIGVLVLCGLIAIAGAWAAAAGGGVVVAVLVIAAGAAILAGAVVKPVRWLILPAVVLALSAGAVSAAGIDLDGGVGDRSYRPASAVDLRDRYELGIGELELDLRDADLPAGDRPLELDVGVGEARLVVPEDVCVATDAEVGAGVVRVFEHDSGGLDVDVLDEPQADSDTTRLVVSADIGVGALNVVNDRDELERGFGRNFDEDFEDSFAADGNAACTETAAGERG